MARTTSAKRANTNETFITGRYEKLYKARWDSISRLAKIEVARQRNQWGCREAQASLPAAFC